MKNQLELLNIEKSGLLVAESQSALLHRQGSKNSLMNTHRLSNGAEAFVSRYGDFQTIDWLRDRTLSFLRTIYYHELYRRPGLCNKLKMVFEASSEVMLLALIGVIGAFTALLVAEGVHFFSDFREGLCVRNVIYCKQMCCWNSKFDPLVGCDSWKTWGEVLGVARPSFLLVIDYFMYVTMSCAYICASAFMVKMIAPYAGGGGISEIKTILSGFVMRGFLGFTTYIVKSVAIILSAASGLMLGQEAPLVHIACCISNILIRFFPRFRENEADKREILLAGSGAGVAIAFKAPISGVLFSLEETSFYFSSEALWKTFFVALAGAFTLSLLLPYSNDNTIIYNVTPAEWHVFELPIFALIGALGGLYGGIYTRGAMLWSRIKNKTGYEEKPIAEALILTIVTSVLCYPFKFARMSNHHVIKHMLRSCIYRNSSISGNLECQRVIDKMQNINPYSPMAETFILDEIKDSIIAVSLKSVLFVLTFGVKVPSGVFVPCIVLGALIGRPIGLTVEYLSRVYPKNFVFLHFCVASNHRCIYPSLYSIVGAAALLGGVTQMTLCVVTLMVEITGKMNYILPLILAVMMAKWVANGLLKRGIYEEVSIRNNYPHLSNKEEVNMPYLVKDGLSLTFRNSLVTIPHEGMKLFELVSLMEDFPYSGYPVVRGGDLLFGFVTREDILTLVEKCSDVSAADHSMYPVYFTDVTNKIIDHANRKICLKHIINTSPTCISPYAYMNALVYIFQKLGVSHIMVVEMGVIQGIITRKDAILQLRGLRI